MGSEQSQKKPTPFNPYLQVTIERIDHNVFCKKSIVYVSLDAPKGIITPTYVKSQARISMDDVDNRRAKLDMFDGVRGIRFEIRRNVKDGKLHGYLKLSKIEKDIDRALTVPLFLGSKKRVGSMIGHFFRSGVQTQREALLPYALDEDPRQLIILSHEGDKDKNLKNCHDTAIHKVLTFIRDHSKIIEVERIQTKVVDLYIVSIAVKFVFLRDFIERAKKTPLVPSEKKVFSIMIPPREDGLRVRNMIFDSSIFAVTVKNLTFENPEYEKSFDGKLRLVGKSLNSDGKILECIRWNKKDWKGCYFKFKYENELKRIRIELQKTRKLSNAKVKGFVEMNVAESIKKCRYSDSLKSHEETHPIYHGTRSSQKIMGGLEIMSEVYWSEVQDLGRIRPRVNVQQFQSTYIQKQGRYVIRNTSKKKDNNSVKKAQQSAKSSANRFCIKYDRQIDLICIDECKFLKYNRRKKEASEQDACMEDCCKVWFKIKKLNNRVRSSNKRKEENPVVDMNEDPFDF